MFVSVTVLVADAYVVDVTIIVAVHMSTDEGGNREVLPRTDRRKVGTDGVCGCASHQKSQHRFPPEPPKEGQCVLYFR